MKVTHENMMGFVLESLGIELVSSAENKAIWKDVDGNQISQDIEFDNNHRVVASHVRYGETVSLELNGFGIAHGSSVQVTIIFDHPALSALRINPDGLRFTMTAKGDSIETPSFKIPLDWYDESKETYEYGSTQDLPHTYVPINKRLRISAKLLVDGDRSELDASNHLVPVTYRRNYEELIGLFKRDENESSRADPAVKHLEENYENHFISLNTTGMVDLVEGFLDFMKGDFSDTTKISGRVETDARRLWELAISQSKGGNYDDRPLYWARNKMQVALKRHPLFKKDFNLQTSEVLKENEDGDESVLFLLIRRFEELSRNYKGVDFSEAKVEAKIEIAATEALKKAQDELASLEADSTTPQAEIDAAKQAVKEAENEVNRVENPIKVLVTGFDPFYLNEFNHPTLKDDSNILQSNPSGCVALNLDDLIVGYGFIQTMVFPVRYYDFDDKWDHQSGEGEGVVERTIRPLLENGNRGEQPDMIITMSQTLSGYNIDVFATSRRGGGKENMDFSRQSGTQSIAGGVENILTNLPDHMIDQPLVKYDGEYVRRDGTTGTARPDGNPWPGNQQVIRGPGGSYLSNEIFYRVGRMREIYNSSLPRNPENQDEFAEGIYALRSGHFHIEKLQDESQDEDYDNNEVFTQTLKTVSGAIKRGIEQLSDEFHGQ